LFVLSKLPGVIDLILALRLTKYVKINFDKWFFLSYCRNCRNTFCQT